MIEGTKVKLSGVEYEIPPLNLKALRRLLPAISNMKRGTLEDADVATMIDVVHSAAKRNYPDMSVDVVEDGLDMGNLQSTFNLVLGRSGLTMGNVPAATPQATEPLSIGPGSTGISSPQPDGPTTM